MREDESGPGEPMEPSDWRRIFPLKPAAVSDRLGWVGLEAARYRDVPASEINSPALTHHRLVFVARPLEELDLRYEGVELHVPPPAGSILLVPAGTSSLWRWSGANDALHIYLQPALVDRVAADEFDLDPTRLSLPPLDGVNLPHLRAAMLAVGDELALGSPGGRLAVESLANVLAVQLIRQVLAPRSPRRTSDGALPRDKLRAVLEYIEETLDASLTLNEMAAVARLSAYHFARQFKAATGMPPHQYVIARRVERAQQLLQPDRDLSLAEVAADAGFSDQSQFSHHFKRLVGVTPKQFRTSARIA